MRDVIWIVMETSCMLLRRLRRLISSCINVMGGQAEILINFLYHKLILIVEGVVYTTEEQLCGMLYHHRIHDTATFTDFRNSF